MAVYWERFKAFFIVLSITLVVNRADSEAIEENCNQTRPDTALPVGKPLVRLTEIHNLNESISQEENQEMVDATTMVRLPETSTSSFISDYFSFIDEYPDYWEERNDFDDNYEYSDLEEEVQPHQHPQQPITFRQDCQCGLPSINRIVGGSFTNIKKYPWNVQILLKVKKFPFCGGSIINSLYILTAAHCLEDLKAQDISVRVGHTSAKEPGIIVEVLSIRMHEKYNKRDVTRNDIGLIRLEKNLDFTDKILPVCLHTRTKYANENAIVTGWGRISETGKYSDTLKHAAVLVYEFDYCRRISRYAKKTIHGGILCARRKRTDACQGDSGGPLVYYEKSIERFVIIGITSYGIGCARFVYPGIYTKVVVFRDWIMTHTKDSTYCPVKSH